MKDTKQITFKAPNYDHELAIRRLNSQIRYTAFPITTLFTILVVWGELSLSGVMPVEHTLLTFTIAMVFGWCIVEVAFFIKALIGYHFTEYGVRVPMDNLL